MCWIDEKPKGVGRPKLKKTEKRVELRVTVHPKISEALSNCDDPKGRVIDRAVSVYLGLKGLEL